MFLVGPIQSSGELDVLGEDRTRIHGLEFLYSITFLAIVLYIHIPVILYMYGWVFSKIKQDRLRERRRRYAKTFK